jgi:hypothetical protein
VEVGRDPQGLMRVLYVTLNINDNRQQAEAETEEFLKAYYGATWKIIHESQGFASGEPELCAEFFRGFAHAGVNHFMVRFSAVNQEEQMDRLVSEVLPLVTAP